MGNYNTEKELKKLKEEFELEKANIRSNYFLTIFVMIAYILIEKTGDIVLFEILFSKLQLFLGIVSLLVLFYIKDLIKYSQYIVKKYIFKINN